MANKQTLGEIIKIALEDVAECFKIEKDLYKTYCKEEILKNKTLVSMIDKRSNEVIDWNEKTPLGGPGTVLNAVVLYSLIRHYELFMAVETGVSGGFYTTFLLEALLGSNGGILRSIEISDNKEEVGKLIPKKWFESPSWHLEIGTNSLDSLKNEEDDYNRIFHLYCHDSLHTMSHMTKELIEFKKCKNDRFFIFFDDQNSDLFWDRCLKTNTFLKPGYDVKYISGSESRLKKHMGGFLKYDKHSSSSV